MWLFRTNGLLWAASAAVLFALAGFLPLERSGGDVFNFWTTWALVFSGDSLVGSPADTGMILVIVGFRYAVAALVLGWLVQRLILLAREDP